MTHSRELLYGERAGEIGARALAFAPDELPGVRREPGRERVALAFDAGGLQAAERALLERLPTARTGAIPAGGAGPAGERWLSIERDELTLAAERSLPAACLEAALRAAEEPPAPPRFMGVVNATPDSFSDGGRFLEPERAIERGLELEAEGATLLDVGGESTRPGSAPVPVDEELRRVLPVVEGLAGRVRARIGVDTSKAAVARAALDAGATMVNDVTAGRGDPDMLPLVAERRCELVLMHMLGTPADMQRAPSYRDPVAEIARFLRERVAACIAAGIDERRVLLDPGIGFGKTLEHNLDLLRRLRELRSLGRPLCLGVSRKSFIHKATAAFRRGQPGLSSPPAPDRTESDRCAGTAVALAACIAGGAELLRVHEVARAIQATAVALAVQRRSLLPEGLAFDKGPGGRGAEREEGSSPTTSRTPSTADGPRR